MELRQLEYLVAVVEEANFTRAAARVHISQSGVSAQVKALEHELGTTLVDRSGGTVTPTAAGLAALEHGRAALTAVAAVRRAVNDVAGVVRGRIVVGMVVGCTVAPLFDALATFHRAHPGVDVTLVEDGSDRLLGRTRTGDVDLALVGTAGVPAGVESLTIVSEGLVAAVPRDHVLAGRDAVDLTELVGHPLVGLPEGTGIRTVLDRSCAAAGVRPHVVLQASAPGAVADLAARGLGVAVLSASSVEHPELCVVPVNGATAPAVLALAWRPGSDPAVRALLGHCRSAFGKPLADGAGSPP